MLKRILILTLLLLVFVPIHGQEETGEETEELPVIPYFSASNPARKFNIPIPEGWQNVGSDNQAHLINEDETENIYALAVTADTTEDGVQEAIQQILPGTEPELSYSNVLNIDGVDWSEYLYKLPDGTITAFCQTRDDVVYSVIYINQQESDFYMLAVEQEDAENVQPDVDAALTQIYPTFESSALETDVVAYANSPWTRNVYALEDGTTLRTLQQVRGRNTFVVIETGDGDLLETVNRSFFTVIFGFFVTPDSVDYLYLGLGAIAFFLTVFVVAFFVRQRNLQKDMELLKQLQQEET